MLKTKGSGTMTVGESWVHKGLKGVFGVGNSLCKIVVEEGKLNLIVCLVGDFEPVKNLEVMLGKGVNLSTCLACIMSRLDVKGVIPFVYPI
ncbi:hypothetical protein LR48_Vigan11g064700 [Vigna angularis]|uniref:Uncharacterized protein n=1 Tax=Phaseolus angularis TaxID=3914 RepID=A0A0L9VS91_PHAAN|nr:hypothetical protein LR48_Vigan11g064700 [Vigna angularis]